MLPSDKKRLEREANIRAATRGSDSSAYFEDVGKEKAYYAKLRAAADERRQRLALLRRYHPQDLEH